MLITSAESWSARVVKEGCYFGGVYLSLGGRQAGKSGRVVKLGRWDGKVYDLSEVTRWERCVGGVR